VQDVRTAARNTLGSRWTRRHFKGVTFDLEGDANDYLQAYGADQLDSLLERLERSVREQTETVA